MTANSQISTSDAIQVELKAAAYTLPTLLLNEMDPEAADALLAERTARAPAFFRNSPIVIDLSKIAAATEADSNQFAMLIGVIRGYGLVPVGIRGGSAQQREQAELMELAVLPESRPERAKDEPARPAAPVRIPARVIDAPIRSGQRVYAQDTDLILLGPVSSGAEVVADGHVHAYGPIRGRVLAGVKGDISARVFCADLMAELISIAGRYKVSEDLERRFSGRPVQVTLDGDALVFQQL